MIISISYLEIQCKQIEELENLSNNRKQNKISIIACFICLQKIDIYLRILKKFKNKSPWAKLTKNKQG